MLKSTIDVQATNQATPRQAENHAKVNSGSSAAENNNAVEITQKTGNMALRST